MSGPRTRAIGLEDVAPIELRHDSWSRVVVSDKTVEGNHASLGYSVFGPGLVTADRCHSVDALCFVLSGHGVIRLEDGDVEVSARSGLYIPARAWHTVVNDGDADLVMVFSFPWPDYPPTERRDARG